MPLLMLICKLRHLQAISFPLLRVADVLNYLDRNNIATAPLGTPEEDIGLIVTQYNMIISIFFVGYILTQVPTNMILRKMRQSIFLSTIMCLWAGTLYLFSSWYTKQELAKRTSILYATGQMSGAFGCILGSAFVWGMEGKAGLPA